MRWLVVAALALEVFAAFVVSAILFLPFGIAEPGQPDGMGPLVLVWSVAELLWSLWSFARPRFRFVRPGPRLGALAIVTMGIVVGSVAGLKLSDGRAWNAACYAMAVANIVGCQFGRYFLRTGAVR